MPDELQRIDKALRKVGLGSLADEGVLMLNRAAEDAVKDAIPIFVNAVKNISIADAKSIIMGNNRAATTFLETQTTQSLYTQFKPVIQQSFAKVGADKVWNQIISKYNGLPLVKKVNPDLTDYTTRKALTGVFTMIALEEQNIRTNLNMRPTKLLQQVFALQDRK